ncbi:MAG: hypothetical protein JJU06_04195 [Ectothiorhodospiraceae bacterium]|nr:hypothetical protein [Ectothiorhodospiraceae bacterium]MCH8503738.1 hypothetical protein [Ectothiorhodospiraceae bacterium]
MTIRPIQNPVRLAEDEINKALEQAAAAIDAYEQDHDDVPPWEACRTHLEEVRGAVMMLDIQGAVVLCNECLGLIDALESGTSLSREQGLDLLMYGLLLLPRYLSRVAEQRRELPDTLLPTLNALRGLRRSFPLPEFHFAAFNRVDPSLPQLSAPDSTVAENMDETGRRLRLMLQIGLLGLFRSPDSQVHAKQVHRALVRMGEAFGNTACGRWMRLAAKAFHPLVEQRMTADISMRLLLSRIDLHARACMLQGREGLDTRPPELVSRGLLYYTMRGSEHDETLAELREQLGLSVGVAPPALVEHEREAMAAPDQSVMEAVTKAVRDDLDRLKDMIESLSRLSSITSSERKELAAQLSDMAGTLTVLGLSELAALLKREQTKLHSLSENAGGERLAEILTHAAETLTEVEEQIYTLSRPGGRGSRPGKPRRLMEAEQQALTESLKNLQRIHRALEYLNGDLDEGEDLGLMAQPVAEIAGTLRILGRDEAAALMIRCDSQLKQFAAHPRELDKIDALADALAAIEWFLEGLLEGLDQGEEALDLAREALKALETRHRRA